MGMPIDKQKSAPIPDFETFKSKSYDERLYPHLQDKETSSPEVGISDNCENEISCTFWLGQSWNSSETEEKILPCLYLIFDVCYGYHACKCSNGYFMTTKGMNEDKLFVEIEET